MAEYSPELIKRTISIFESRTGRIITEEDARQALENISGFFRVLQEWDLAQSAAIEGCVDGGSLCSAKRAKGVRG